MKKLFWIGIFCLQATYCLSQNTSKEYNQDDSATVFISFVIETDGTINKVKLEKIECTNCSKKDKNRLGDEAIKVVKEMPKLPNHKKRTKYLLPVKIKTQD